MFAGISISFKEFSVIQSGNGVIKVGPIWIASHDYSRWYHCPENYLAVKLNGSQLYLLNTKGIIKGNWEQAEITIQILPEWK